MPQFELLLLVKKMPKADLAACLKRAANFILDNNGVLRKIENLGRQQLHKKVPTRIPNTKCHTEMNFFVYHLDMSLDTMLKVKEDCQRDNDISRTFFVKKEPSVREGYRCTLEEELKPPSLRQSVQSLIEKGRVEKKVFDIGPPSARQIC